MYHRDTKLFVIVFGLSVSLLTCIEQLAPERLSPEETHRKPHGERDETDGKDDDDGVLPAEEIPLGGHPRPRQHVRMLLVGERLHGQGDRVVVTRRHCDCHSSPRHACTAATDSGHTACRMRDKIYLLLSRSHW